MHCQSLTVTCFLLAARAAPLTIPSIDTSNHFTSPLNLDLTIPYFSEDQQPKPLPQVFNTALASFQTLSPVDSNSPTDGLFSTDNLSPTIGNQLAAAPKPPYYAEGCDNPKTCKIYNSKDRTDWVNAVPDTYTNQGNQIGKICPSGGGDTYKCVEYTLYVPTTNCGGSDDCELCSRGGDYTCVSAELLEKPMSSGTPLEFVCPTNRDGHATTCVRWGTVWATVN